MRRTTSFELALVAAVGLFAGSNSAAAQSAATYASLQDLDRGLRRIRYVNRMTETRTEFGTELDEFHAVSVKVRGWGIEAIVSDYEPEAFARFRALVGVENPSIEAVSLADAFEILG